MNTPNPNKDVNITIADSCINQCLVYALRALNDIDNSHSSVCSAINATAKVGSHRQFAPIRDELYVIKGKITDLIKSIESKYDDKDEIQQIKLLV